jgi:hypothetical protein
MAGERIILVVVPNCSPILPPKLTLFQMLSFGSSMNLGNSFVPMEVLYFSKEGLNEVPIPWREAIVTRKRKRNLAIGLLLLQSNESSDMKPSVQKRMMKKT